MQRDVKFLVVSLFCDLDIQGTALRTGIEMGMMSYNGVCGRGRGPLF